MKTKMILTTAWILTVMILITCLVALIIVMHYFMFIYMAAVVLAYSLFASVSESRINKKTECGANICKSKPTSTISFAELQERRELLAYQSKRRGYISREQFARLQYLSAKMMKSDIVSS